MTPTILVVEDNPITTKLVRFTLETHGFAVIEATDDAAALHAFGASKISLVLVDLVLPDMDGFELLTRLRLLPGAPEVPVLAFTGLTSAEVTSRISSVGFDDMITKPIEPSRLVQIVRGYIPPAEGTKPVVANEKPKTIVIADDDAVQRKLVRVRLERAGYDVVAAVADGEEALERVRELRPHAIVSDVLMPRLDGFALCMAVRGDPTIASTPILLITNSYLESEDRDLAIRAGARFGVEALVLSEEPSMSSPGPILDAATQLDRLSQLGRRIRALSANDLVGHSDLALFVNLHPDDLMDIDLIDEQAPLTRIATRVILEITERAALKLSPEVSERLTKLRSLGFRLAVDDIGAGYSGLTTFTELAPEIVKIDMSLVRDVHLSARKQRTIAALASLCHDVGCTVVGEGVETESERSCLRELGCDLLQGYLIGRPSRDLV